MSCGSDADLILIRGTDMVFTVVMSTASDIRDTYAFDVVFREREIATSPAVATPAVTWIDAVNEADGTWTLTAECKLTAAQTLALTKGRDLYWRADLVTSSTRERVTSGGVEVRE